MFWSMWHWQPLVNGYSDFIPPDFHEIAMPINGFPDPESFRIMKERDVRYVVITSATTRREIRQRMLDRFPPYAEYMHRWSDGDRWLYEIVKYPYAV